LKLSQRAKYPVPRAGRGVPLGLTHSVRVWAHCSLVCGHCSWRTTGRTTHISSQRLFRSSPSPFPGAQSPRASRLCLLLRTSTAVGESKGVGGSMGVRGGPWGGPPLNGGEMGESEWMGVGSHSLVTNLELEPRHRPHSAGGGPHRTRATFGLCCCRRVAIGTTARVAHASSRLMFDDDRAEIVPSPPRACNV